MVDVGSGSIGMSVRMAFRVQSLGYGGVASHVLVKGILKQYVRLGEGNSEQKNVSHMIYT